MLSGSSLRYPFSQILQLSAEKQFTQFKGQARHSLLPEVKEAGGHDEMQWKWSKTFPGGQLRQLSSAGPLHEAHVS